MSVPAATVEELARVLELEAGIWLEGGLEVRVADGLDAAARQADEVPAAFARRVLAREPDAVAVFLEHVLVSETAFWRHPEQLEALGSLARAAPGPLAIWSAGCASGEEPYSVAIALLEAGRAGRGDRILATDVSRRALAAGREGVYGPRSFRRMPPPLALRWFEGAGERRVRPEVRALVTFERHNLAAEAPPAGAFDVVLCRNVLIYFGSRTAVDVLRRIAGALRPGGVLVVGPVELPVAKGLDLEWTSAGGTTLLRRPVLPGAASGPERR